VELVTRPSRPPSHARARRHGSQGAGALRLDGAHAIVGKTTQTAQTMEADWEDEPTWVWDNEPTRPDVYAPWLTEDSRSRTASPSAVTTWRERATDVLLATAFVVCIFLPITPALALAGGAVLALALGHRRAALTSKWTKRLLQWSVVGLGAGMNLRVVGGVGLHGLVYTTGGIASTLVIGSWLGRRLRLAPRPALLVSVGTAICGGSAIAAAAPVLEADSEETSVALATVFLLNGVALFLFPAIGHALNLSQSSFGLWAALAIHDTSSVVGAAMAFGPTALATATAVKLSRALFIAPTTAALGWKRGRIRAHVPFFIIGFIVAAAIGTFVAPLRSTTALISVGSRHLLVACLFLIGAGVSRTALRKAGVRPLVHGALLWLAVGSLTLIAILRGWIH
jgi:uncharacterized integral membrane protein (TIGR00698 family)